MIIRRVCEGGRVGGAADRSGSSEAITGPIDRGVDSFGELPRSSETLKKHIDRGFAEASTGPIDRDLGSSDTLTVPMDRGLAAPSSASRHS